MVTRLRTVAEEISPVTTELTRARFFWEEVTVIKMIASPEKKEVMPKSEVCLMGLSQIEEMMLAIERTTRGRVEGEVVMVSLPLVRLRTHQDNNERVAKAPTK